MGVMVKAAILDVMEKMCVSRLFPLLLVKLNEPTLTSCFFRDPEGSLESLVLQAHLALKVLEGRVVSWASLDPRETRETWVHPDHL